MHRPLCATRVHNSVFSNPGVASTSVTPSSIIYPSSILIISQHGPSILTSFLQLVTQPFNYVCQGLCAYKDVYIRTYQRVCPWSDGFISLAWDVFQLGGPLLQTVRAAMCYCCSELAGSPSPPQKLGLF